MYIQVSIWLRFVKRKFLSLLSLYDSIPKICREQDFHYCNLEPGNQIVNYDNRLEVQTCQLSNLAEYVSAIFFFVLELAFKSNNFIILYQAWQLKRNMCAQDLLSMQTICCRLALMDFDWMQQRVREFSKMKSNHDASQMLKIHLFRYQCLRHRQHYEQVIIFQSLYRARGRCWGSDPAIRICKQR